MSLDLEAKGGKGERAKKKGDSCSRYVVIARYLRVRARAKG